MFNNVAAGAHTVVVTDANNCSASRTLTITEPGQCWWRAASAGSIACQGGTTTLTASATGGTTAYSFALDSGPAQASGVFNNVAAGAHTVVVTDANNCSASRTLTITEPPALVAAASAGSIACQGGTTTLTASATGGTAAYSFALDSGPAQPSGVFNNVAAGPHTVVVTDANNCSASRTLTITEPPALVAAASAGSIACQGGTTTLTASATGGTAAYSFALDSGPAQPSGVFNNVAAGPHTVVVTDANNCSASRAITITEPPALVAAASAGSIACQGGTTTLTASATGGTAAYSFALDSGPAQPSGVFNNVAAGPHTVVVTDANNCSASRTLTITEPPALVAAASAGSIACQGGTTTLTASASGGTAAYSFALDSGPAQPSVCLTMWRRARTPWW